MSEKKRIVTLEELQRRLDYFPEVVKRKEKAAEEIRIVKENFKIACEKMFKNKNKTS
jgi:hypothetical protein